MTGDGRPVRVLLVCSGLDHARRGYESFARESFEALRDATGLRLELVKGSGPRLPSERKVPTLRRDRPFTRVIARSTRVPSFRVEARAFGYALAPLLVTSRPDVVYVSEWDTARALSQLRRVTPLDFKILLCNGGFAERGFGFVDHVQQLTPVARDHVVRLGADPARHSVLPLGFDIGRAFEPPTPAERRSLRQQLDLPLDRRILISVAALNRHHKRLDYLIGELAQVPPPRPFLVALGEQDPETPGLRRLADAALGADGYTMQTASIDAVSRFLRASDVFVLTSVAEAQGRSLVEAMTQGLPCIAHETPVMRFALGAHGLFADLTRRGALSGLLNEPVDESVSAAAERHRFVYERFSWDRLAPRYVEMLRGVAAGGAFQDATAKSTVSSSTGDEVLR